MLPSLDNNHNRLPATRATVGLDFLAKLLHFIVVNPKVDHDVQHCGSIFRSSVRHDLGPIAVEELRAPRSLKLYEDTCT